MRMEPANSFTFHLEQFSLIKFHEILQNKQNHVVINVYGFENVHIEMNFRNSKKSAEQNQTISTQWRTWSKYIFLHERGNRKTQINRIHFI